MKFPIFVVMTTFAALSCADDSSPPTVEKSRQSYEEKMKAADERHQLGLTAAKDEYLTQLQMAMDAAFESKDLKEANELDAAIKSMTEKSVAEDSKSPIAVKAKQTYDETAVTVSDTLRKDQEAARNTYQNQLQALLDAALLAKDLEQANRIEAAMKSVAASKLPELKFALIPAGQFTMGSRQSESGHERDETQHRVVLTRPFEMSIYEVTQAQFESVMGANPSHFKGADNPVDQVTWDEAVEYCHRLSELPEENAAGHAYRLPTESEWEYACRGGSDAAFSFGNDPASAGEYAWFNANSGGTSHPVGQKKPNAWGLYDMHGNVFEWCFDWYSSGLIPVSTDPQGAKSGPGRVLRGGAWYNAEKLQRSANRGKNQPGHRDHGYGFRVVRTTSAIETLVNAGVAAKEMVEVEQPIGDADEPKSPLVAKARHTYEKALQDAEVERAATLQVAEEERAATLQAAKDESLKDLQAKLDMALKNKNLEEANKIAATMKLMTDDSVLGDTASPVGKKAKQTYEASLVAANGKYQEHASSARTRYLTDLEAAMDSAFEGRTLRKQIELMQ